MRKTLVFIGVKVGKICCRLTVVGCRFPSSGGVPVGWGGIALMEAEILLNPFRVSKSERVEKIEANSRFPAPKKKTHMHRLHVSQQLTENFVTFTKKFDHAQRLY